MLHVPTKFWFIWLSSFKGEDFLEIDQSETRIACGGHAFTSNFAVIGIDSLTICILFGEI
jgi:hypothetical protein